MLTFKRAREKIKNFGKKAVAFTLTLSMALAVLPEIPLFKTEVKAEVKYNCDFNTRSTGISGQLFCEANMEDKGIVAELKNAGTPVLSYNIYAKYSGSSDYQKVGSISTKATYVNKVGETYDSAYAMYGYINGMTNGIAPSSYHINPVTKNGELISSAGIGSSTLGYPHAANFINVPAYHVGLTGTAANPYVEIVAQGADNTSGSKVDEVTFMVDGILLIGETGYWPRSSGESLYVRTLEGTKFTKVGSVLSKLGTKHTVQAKWSITYADQDRPYYFVAQTPSFTYTVGTPGQSVTPQLSPGVSGQIEVNDVHTYSDKAIYDAIGAPITSYNLYDKTTGTKLGSVSTTSTGDSYNMKGTLTGLTNGKTYDIYAKPVNKYGEATVEGEFQYSTAITPFGPAAAPTVTATPGDGKISMSWSQPNLNGGVIKEYNIYKNGTKVATTTSTSYNMSVTNGTTVSIGVAAVTKDKEGRNGGTVGAITTKSDLIPYGPAAAPGKPSVTVGNGQNTISWSAVAKNGNNTITYEVFQGSTSLGTTTSTSMTKTGLSNGTSYTYTVRAKGDRNTTWSAQSAVSSSVVPYGPAATPSTPSVTVGNGQNTISWGAVAKNGNNTITYEVFQNGTSIGTTTSASMTKTSLSNGTSYTYTVRAQGDRNTTWSAQSAVSAAVIPYGPSAAPSNLTATRGLNKVDLKWTGVPANGNTTITYQITDQNGNQVDTTTNTSYTISSLAGGTAKQYKVRAQGNRNTAWSAFSNTVAVTPYAVPGQVTGLSVSTPKAHQVHLSWNAVPAVGNDSVTYQITDASGNEIATTSATSYDITNLTAGTTYTYKVRANSSPAGYGAFSANVTATAWNYPTAPSFNVKESEATQESGKIYLKWYQSSSQGTPVTGYNIYAKDKTENGAEFKVNNAVIAAGDSSYMATGLKDGHNYEFTIEAICAYGASPRSTAITLMPVSVPSAVASVTAEVLSDTSVKVSWPAAGNNGQSISKYYIETKSGGNIVKTDTTANGTALEYTVTGLTKYTDYTFNVYAESSVGKGAQKESSSVKTWREPFAPSIKVAPTNKTGELSIALTPSDKTDIGPAVEGYSIYISAEGAEEYLYNEALLAASSFPYTLTGLEDGKKYTIRAAAVNTINGEKRQGDYSAAQSDVNTTPRKPANAPTEVAVESISGTEVKITWTAPADLGGSELVRYEILGAGDATVTVDGEGKETSGSVTGLIKGKDYSFTVRAVTLAGDGEESAAAGLTTWNVPSQPTALTVDPTSNSGEIKAVWNEPEADNGSAVTGYNVYLNGELHNKEALVTEKEYTISGLTNGTKYNLQIAAVNGAGEGEKCAAESATPRTTPGAPTVSNARTGDSSAVITITPPEDNGGNAISEYVLYANGVEKGRVSARRIENAVVPNLANGTEYSIQAAAVNAAGEGIKSEQTEEAKILVGLPLTPENIKAEPGNNLDAIITYDEAENHGSPITEYRIYVEGEDAPRTTSKTTTAQVFGSELGGEIRVAVQAVNKVGASPISDYYPVTIGTPTTPEIEQIVPGNGYVTVAWSPSQGNGVKIQGYSIYVDNVKYTGEIKDTDGQALSYVEGSPGLISPNVLAVKIPLDNGGQGHKIEVVCVNLAGESNKSDPVEVVAGAPFAPEKPTVTSSNGSLQVEWSAPSDNGSPITGYKLYLNGAEKTDLILGADARKAVLENLANGGLYSIQIAAVNANGVGGKSPAATGTPATLCTAPTDISVSVLNDTEVKLSWKAPLNNGGSSIKGYNVVVNNEPAAESNIRFDGTTARISNLSRAQSYVFGVAAVNGAGQGVMAYSDEITTYGLPSAPVQVTGEPGNSSATVTWKAPQADGGTPVRGYNVYIDGSSRPANSELLTEMSYTKNGISAGDTTVFQIAAVNDIGAGAKSEPVTVEASTPSRPVISNVVMEGSSFRVEWRGAKPNGGVITGYRVYITGGGLELRKTTANTYYEVTDQTPGTVFKVQVEAMNSLGYSSQKSEEVTVIVGAPSAPSLSLERGYEQIVAGWEAPNDNGSSITGYQVYVNGEKYGEATNGTAMTITGLAGGEEYEVRVAALNKNGEGILSDTLNAVPYSKPMTPGITSITAQDGSFYVSHTEAKGAGLAVSGYEIWVDDVLKATTTELENSVTGVANGVSHKVQVRAFSQVTDGNNVYGDFSAAETVMTGTPEAPEITEAITGDRDITIRYTQPEGNGSPVIGYNIYVDGNKAATTKRNEAILTALQDGSSLVNGTAYLVSVEAMNERGYGKRSEAVEVIPGRPAAPTITQAAGSDGSITVKWDEPDANGGTILMYRVYVNGQFMDEVTLTSFTRSGLKNGTDYRVQVTAVGTQGESVKSREVIVTPGTKADPPENVVAVATGADSVEITWDAPAETGGIPIKSYEVTGAGEIAVDSDKRTAAVTGLEKGGEYVFSVIAVNGAGMSQEAYSNKVKTFTEPGKPEIYFVDNGDGILTPQWYAPKDNGGSEVVSYNLYVDGHKFNTDPIEATATDKELQNYILSGTSSDGVITLETGLIYQITLTAINEVGESGQSAPYRQKVIGEIVKTPPKAPRNVSVIGHDKSLEITWDAPSYNGGAPIMGYHVYLNGNKVTTDDKLADKDARTYTATKLGSVDLVNGTEYIVTVAAVNEAGTGVLSTEAVGIPQKADAPGVPQNVTYTNNSTMDTMIVRWNAPAQDGGDSDITYNVYLGTDTTPAASGLSQTSYVMSVESGLTYEIKVSAQNSGGESDTVYIRAMNDLNVDVNGDGSLITRKDENCDGVIDNEIVVNKPGAPTNVEVTGSGTENVTLTWMAPGDDGGAEIQGYIVYINGAPNSIQKDTLSYSFQTEAGKVYTIYIAAVNEAGTGAKSEGRVAYGIGEITGRAPDSPVIDKASYDSETGKVNVTWTAPENIGTSAITKYIVSVNADEFAVTAPENEIEIPLSYSFEGIKGADYIIRVAAVNETGASPKSEPAAVTVPDDTQVPDEPVVIPDPTVPGRPTALVLDASGTAMNLSWTAPEYTGGIEADEENPGKTKPVEITGYNVYVNNKITASIEKNAEGTFDIYAYTDGLKEETPSQTTDTPTAYSYAGEADMDYVIWVDAVNKVGNGGISNAVSHSTKAEPEDPSLIPGKPAVSEPTVTPGNDGTNVTITVKPDANGKLPDSYDVIVNGEKVDESQITVTGPDEEGNMQITVTVPNGEDSVIQVVGNKDTVTDVPRVDENGEPVLDPDTGEQIIDQIVTKEPGISSDPIVVEGKEDQTQDPVVTKPGAVTNLTAVTESENAITLTWALTDNGGEAVTGYELYVNGVLDDTANVTESPYIYTAEANKEYVFQIAATNSKGTGEKSNLATADTLTDNSDNPPVPPVLAGAPAITGTVSNGADKIKVIWTAPAENAENITGYNVYVGTELAAENVDALEYVLTIDHTNQIVITVAAVINGIAGEPSNEWKTSLNLNIDSAGGLDKADQNVDSDGDGKVEETVPTVKISGKISLGGSNEPVTAVVKNPNGYIVKEEEVASEFTLEIPVENTINMFAGDSVSGYTLMFSRQNYTSYTITGVTFDSDVVINKTITLYSGDVNQDDYIDGKDTAMVIRSYGTNVVDGDINGDGYVDGKDTAMVIRNYNMQSVSVNWAEMK